VTLTDIETININQNAILNSTQMLGSSLDATGAGGSIELSVSDSGVLDFTALTQTGVDSMQFANVANDITIDENSVDLKAGSAGDNFNYANADFTSVDTITGGAGTDSISFSDAMTKDYESDFANVNSVESFIGSASADSFTLDFSSIATMNTNSELFDGALGNDTVSLEATNLNLALDTSITQAVFDNIENIDVTGITFNVASSDIVLDTATMKGWSDGGNDITINITDDTQGGFFSVYDSTATSIVETSLSTTGGDGAGNYTIDGLSLHVV